MRAFLLMACLPGRREHCIEKSDKMKYAREKVKQVRDDSPMYVRFSDDNEDRRTRHIYVSGILVPF